jgi:hypothetical protein
LAFRLKAYGIRSEQVRIGDINRRGYLVEAFADAWQRYCPSASAFASDERYKRYKRYKTDNENNFVTDVADVALGTANLDPDSDPVDLALDDAKVAYEERAAILEYDADLDREEAEAAAAEELWPELPEFLRRKAGSA